MTSRPKQRRKKPIEALDWRELAEAPALRGLSEVLSTPPEIARERASKRAVVESATLGQMPTVGESPRNIAEPEMAVQPPTDFPSLPDAGGSSSPPTLGETPTVAVKPTVGQAGPEESLSTGSVTPTEVVITSEVMASTEGDTDAVDDTPSGRQPNGRGSRAAAISISQPPKPPAALQRAGSPYLVGAKPSVIYPPSVGEAPIAKKAGWWIDSAGARYEGKRVQRVIIAQHAMSLGEERVYETLWHARESDGVFADSRRSKTFSLGYDRIARLVRLNEKSVRILLPKLIAKRILEVVAAEDSACRIGRTYRIFSYEEILERQRAANLTAVVKNGRAVEFVWHVEEVDAPGRGTGVTPTVGVSISAYPPELAAKVRAVVPGFDEEALKTLWANCCRIASDCTADEVEYCLNLKARQLLARGRAVHNPVGLMLWAVPKCFEGPAALHLVYRRQKQAEDELRRQEEERFRAQLEEYRRLVSDPATSPEEREWYQRVLADLG